MPTPAERIASTQAEEKLFDLKATLFGPIKPDRELLHLTQRALKSADEEREYFTEITLLRPRNPEQPGQMEVRFLVTASSPAKAELAGIVYLGQLCDVLSSVTRQPIRFLRADEDPRDERIRGARTSTNIDRILTRSEWDWILGALVPLRKDHPRYLAASSWYRKGLCGIDPLEIVCCFWRVVERLALSYVDESKLPRDEKDKPIKNAKTCVRGFVTDFNLEGVSKGFLADEAALKEIVKLRNDVSHGNEPITPQLIETASSLTVPLEEAAFACLSAVRKKIDAEPVVA